MKPIFDCNWSESSPFAPMVWLHASYLDTPAPFPRPNKPGDFYDLPTDNLRHAAQTIREGGQLTDAAGNRPIPAPWGSAYALDIEGHAQAANMTAILRWVVTCKQFNPNKNLGVFYGTEFDSKADWPSEYWTWGITASQARIYNDSIRAAMPLLTLTDWVDLECYCSIRWFARDLTAALEKLKRIKAIVGKKPVYLRCRADCWNENRPLPAGMLRRMAQTVLESAGGLVWWGLNDQLRANAERACA